LFPKKASFFVVCFHGDAGGIDYKRIINTSKHQLAYRKGMVYTN